MNKASILNDEIVPHYNLTVKVVNKIGMSDLTNYVIYLNTSEISRSKYFQCTSEQLYYEFNKNNTAVLMPLIVTVIL